MIRFYHVSKRYPGGQQALLDVSFHLPAGRFAFLTGASGAGKSTLLKLIYRGETPTDGQVLVGGRNVGALPPAKIPYLRRTMGIVFQDFRLIQRKTVFENLAYLPRILGFGPEEQKRLALGTLERVGLGHRMEAFPAELSGGEQQRISIARALMNSPELLLADEPTGNLDPDLSEEIFDLFREINAAGTTILVATHDREIIHRVGGRVLFLEEGVLIDDRDGREPGEKAAGERA